MPPHPAVAVARHRERAWFVALALVLAIAAAAVFALRDPPSANLLAGAIVLTVLAVPIAGLLLRRRGR